MEVAQEMKNRTNNVTHTMSAKDVLPVMFSPQTHSVATCLHTKLLHLSYGNQGRDYMTYISYIEKKILLEKESKWSTTPYSSVQGGG